MAGICKFLGYNIFMIYLDAGTTYSKIISDEDCLGHEYLYTQKSGYRYYILNSDMVKSMKLTPDFSCGHMANSTENEIVALAKGALKHDIDSNATVLDLGSRDAKWVRFKDRKFHDMDWNTSCASSTGATVEMLLKFYDINSKQLEFNPEKFVVTCGIFGIEKIMDSISNGEAPEVAISKFVHGIAFNAWNFAKRPDRIYLSGGFCENKCLADSLANYCEVIPLGRFLLCEGLIK